MNEDYPRTPNCPGCGAHPCECDEPLKEYPVCKDCGKVRCVCPPKKPITVLGFDDVGCIWCGDTTGSCDCNEPLLKED